MEWSPSRPGPLLRTAALLAALPLSICLGAESHVHHDSRLGYSLTYPADWAPSGIAYSNAFEIRNYPVDDPSSVPERNRATLIAIQTTNENPAASEAWLDELLKGQPPEARAERIRWIDGRRAVRMRSETPPYSLGPGALRTSDPAPAAAESGYVTIETYVAAGKYGLTVRSSVPAGADEEVLQEVLAVHDSIRFDEENPGSSGGRSP